MRIRLRELMALTGASNAEIGAILWPDSCEQTRRVMLARWLSAGVPTIRLDQLKALSEYFNTTNIENLIDYES
jgi:hypothetical protein